MNRRSKYSLDEITRMRASVMAIGGGSSMSPIVAEEQLRTYMANGTEPSELEREAAKALEGNK